MKKLFCWFPFVMSLFSANAQQLVNFDSLQYPPDFSAKLAVFQDSTGKMTFDKVLKKTFSSYTQRNNSPANANGAFWLRIEAQNTNARQPQNVVLNCGKPIYFDLYFPKANSSPLVVEGGINSLWPQNHGTDDGYGLPIRFAAGQKMVFYARIVTEDFYQKKMSIVPRFFSEIQYRDFKNARFQQKYLLLIFFAFTMGCLLFGAAFTVFQYVFKKDNALLIYALVAFLSAIMLLRMAEYHLEIRLISTFIPYFFALYYLIQYALAIAYFLFIISIFNLKTTLPRLHKTVRVIVGIYVLVFSGFVWLTYYTINERRLLFSTNSVLGLIGILLLVILGYVVVVIARQKVWLSAYILAGFGSLIVGYATVIFLTTNQPRPVYDNFWRIPSVYMGLGMVAELFCFLLALGKRTQRTEQERDELAKTRQQLQGLNNTLEQKVNQRTTELQVALTAAQEALLKGQTTERRRVASELHDNLGGLLAALKMTTHALDTRDLHPQEQEIYGQMVTMINDANRQVRSLSHNLLPEELAEIGLVASLEKLVSKLNISHQTHFDLRVEGLASRLDKPTEFNLYTIVLELCNNIIKHAHASEAVVEVIQEAGVLHLLVSDNGAGFAANETQNEGMGLKNLHERAEAVGGVVRVHSQKGEGTVVSLKISQPSRAAAQT